MILELGCGHGHWLTSLAGLRPNELMVGVDLISRRIRLAREKQEKRGLENVLFLKAEGTEILEAWPKQNPVAQVFLLHPDPWPKKRHAKNRMTGEKFLTRIARVMGEGGEIYFRTDDPEFFSWSKDSFANHPDWRLVDLPWPHEAGSYFKDLLGVHGALTATRTMS